MTMERQAHIELMLVQEFEAEGHKVKKVDGSFIALIKTHAADSTIEHILVDLTRIAEAIEGRLS